MSLSDLVCEIELDFLTPLWEQRRRPVAIEFRFDAYGQRHSLSALLYRDGPWIAQCLEYDLSAEDELAGEAVLKLETCLLQAAEFGVFKVGALQPAPKRYWKRYRKALARERRRVRRG